jgi:hypothetical protein
MRRNSFGGDLIFKIERLADEAPFGMIVAQDYLIGTILGRNTLGESAF